MQLDHLTIRTRSRSATKAFFPKLSESEEKPGGKKIAHIAGRWRFCDDRPFVHLVAGGGDGNGRKLVFYLGVVIDEPTKSNDIGGRSGDVFTPPERGGSRHMNSPLPPSKMKTAAAKSGLSYRGVMTVASIVPRSARPVPAVTFDGNSALEKSGFIGRFPSAADKHRNNHMISALGADIRQVHRSSAAVSSGVFIHPHALSMAKQSMPAGLFITSSNRSIQ